MRCCASSKCILLTGDTPALTRSSHPRCSSSHCLFRGLPAPRLLGDVWGQECMHPDLEGYCSAAPLSLQPHCVNLLALCMT
jgi:hypothetical protein